jgi:hypothetical protein
MGWRRTLPRSCTALDIVNADAMDAYTHGFDRPDQLIGLNLTEAGDYLRDFGWEVGRINGLEVWFTHEATGVSMLFSLKYAAEYAPDPTGQGEYIIKNPGTYVLNWVKLSACK